MQEGKQAGRLVIRRVVRQADIKTGGRHTDVHVGKQADEQAIRQVNRREGGRPGERVDRWASKRTSVRAV